MRKGRKKSSNKIKRKKSETFFSFRINGLRMLQKINYAEYTRTNRFILCIFEKLMKCIFKISCAQFKFLFTYKMNRTYMYKSVFGLQLISALVDISVNRPIRYKELSEYRIKVGKKKNQKEYCSIPEFQ